MKPTAGYDGPTPEDEEKVKPPEECKWEVRLDSVASAVEGESHYATILVDDEPLGSMRLPSPDYVRWLRERIQE